MIEFISQITRSIRYFSYLQKKGIFAFSQVTSEIGSRLQPFRSLSCGKRLFIYRNDLTEKEMKFITAFNQIQNVIRSSVSNESEIRESIPKRISVTRRDVSTSPAGIKAFRVSIGWREGIVI